jgi:hypothetical protein
MPRYANKKIFLNDAEYYDFLRKNRSNTKGVRQYDTQILKNPTIADRSALKTVTHVWKYGDRYYKLADQYYNDVDYWWVIAWWNAIPTEADVSPGDAISIPLNLEEALQVLRTF